ncbi:sialin-like [Antedon mediterranea]|uniref:sialin-like n=1 Tax=Antedon mediterranea TaxID=105859 RepID=UPI003AF4EDF6
MVILGSNFNMKRFIVAGMCCLVQFLFYCTKLNMSIAMIAMVRQPNASGTEMSFLKDNTSVDDQHSSIPTFNWDERTQQYILGAFYIGYTITPIPGGYIAGIMGGKLVVGLAVIVVSLVSALVPFAAGVSTHLLIVLRVIDGLAQGIGCSALYVILGKWTVPNERSIMVSIAYNGMTLGTICSSHLSGWICTAYSLGGWPVSFYTYGVFGFLWLLIWATLIYETPSTDPLITKNELKYFNNTEQKANVKYTSVPWKDIFTSPAVWAVAIGYTAYDFGWYLAITEFPIFLSSILGYDARKAGFLTSVPSLVRLPVVLISAFCADSVIRRDILSILNTRKLFVVIDLGVSSVCFIVLSQVGESVVASMLLIILIFCAFGFNPASLSTNALDLSPKYSGIIIGVVIMVSSTTGFVGPFILGELITHNNTFGQWSILFMITSAVLFFGMVFFLIFGDAEEQGWSPATDPGEMKVLLNKIESSDSAISE